MLPVINAGRWLDDDGVGKAQFILGQLGGIDRCGQDFRVGVGDAELLADLVELGLFLDGAVQVGGRAGGDILGQLGLTADDHRGVIVGAAEQIEPLALMLCRKLVQNAQHRVLVVHIGHGGKVDDFGILGRSHRVAAIGVALDAVSLMERPGKVVAVQVCTKEYRDNVGHGKVHLQFFKLGFPLGGRLIRFTHQTSQRTAHATSGRCRQSRSCGARAWGRPAWRRACPGRSTPPPHRS